MDRERSSSYELQLPSPPSHHHAVHRYKSPLLAVWPMTENQKLPCPTARIDSLQTEEGRDARPRGLEQVEGISLMCIVSSSGNHKGTPDSDLGTDDLEEES